MNMSPERKVSPLGISEKPVYWPYVDLTVFEPEVASSEGLKKASSSGRGG